MLSMADFWAMKAKPQNMVQSRRSAVATGRDMVSELGVEGLDELLDLFGRGVVDEGEAEHAVVRVDAERLHQAPGVEIATGGHDAVLDQAPCDFDAGVAVVQRDGGGAGFRIGRADEADVVAPCEVVREAAS